MHSDTTRRTAALAEITAALRDWHVSGAASRLVAYDDDAERAARILRATQTARDLGATHAEITAAREQAHA